MEIFMTQVYIIVYEHDMIQPQMLENCKVQYKSYLGMVQWCHSLIWPENSFGTILLDVENFPVVTQIKIIHSFC